MEFFQEFGVPQEIVTYVSKELKILLWVNLRWENGVSQHKSEPYIQFQNMLESYMC